MDSRAYARRLRLRDLWRAGRVQSSRVSVRIVRKRVFARAGCRGMSQCVDIPNLGGTVPELGICRPVHGALAVTRLAHVLKFTTIEANLRTSVRSMSKQPIEFMFSPYRRQVLAVLLLRPDEQFHVRELARMTGVSAGSLHRELKAMAESGLLIREKLGNQVFYRANVDCSIYKEIAAIFRKTVGVDHIATRCLVWPWRQDSSGICVWLHGDRTSDCRQRPGYLRTR